MAGRCRWPRPSCPATSRALRSCLPSPARVRRPFRARTAVPPAGSGPARASSPARRRRRPAPARGSAAAGQPSNRHTSIPPASLHANAERIHSHTADRDRPPGQLLNAHTCRIPCGSSVTTQPCHGEGPASTELVQPPAEPPADPGRTRTGTTTGLKGALVSSNTLREGKSQRERALTRRSGQGMLTRWQRSRSRNRAAGQDRQLRLSAHAGQADWRDEMTWSYGLVHSAAHPRLPR